MRVEICTDFRALEKLAPEWDRLWRANPQNEIFSTFAWARASWLAYGHKRVLCTPVVYEGSTVVGILPLARVGKTLRFVGAPRSDYNDMLCAADTGPETLRVALEALAADAPACARGVLENVPEDSMLLRHWRQILHRPPLKLHNSPSSVCHSVLFSSHGDSVLDSILKKKKLRQRAKKMRQLGNFVFRHLESRAEIKAQLPEFFQQHMRRRAQMGDKSLFCFEESRNFYQALVDELDPARELRFAVIELDGKPVAFHFGFECNGKFVYYKPTFELQLRQYSPGEVLNGELFEYAGRRGLREFDFTVGDEAYKARYANRTRYNHTLFFFRHTARGRIEHLLCHAKDRIKKHPSLLRWVRTPAAATARLRRSAGPNPEGI
jgi:CelD/BcsL family acetyltransferase involved in cellulose biosynthesis